ncbi:MAG: acyltransferase family protein [Microthrixaceae bacterium]
MSWFTTNQVFAAPSAASQAGLSAVQSERRARQMHTVPALDGLRGIAIAMVLGAHLGVPGLLSGGVGVDLFFVVSGFLITSLLLREWAGAGSVSLRSFYRRRALRLGPELVVLLAVCLFFGGVLVYSGDRSDLFVVVAGALTFTSNWLLIAHPAADGALSFLWSLAIEVQFYLLWPLIFTTVRRRGWSLRRCAQALLVIACLVALLRALSWREVQYPAMPWQYSSTVTRCDGLLVGCSLAMFRYGGGRPPAAVLKALPWMAWAALGLLGLSGFYSRAHEEVLIRYGLTAAVLASAVMVAVVIWTPDCLFAQMIGRPRLVLLGVLSYSLYLWHQPLLFVIYHWFPVVGQHLRYRGPIGVVGSAALAWASHRYIGQWGRVRRRA